MGNFLPYGLMILAAAAMYAIYWKNSAPVRRACDRFGLLFIKAHDYAEGTASAVPYMRREADGTARLLPPEEQPEAVREALARGADGETARCDAEMEKALRDLFEAVGSSGHDKLHYFDYMNSCFTLHRLFLRACAQPELTLSKQEQKNLALYMGNRGKLVEILAQRMSRPGRKALAEHAGEQLLPQEGEIL